MVCCGFVSDCRFAIWPMSFSPRGVNATIDGVVRAPSRLAITRGLPPSITAMQQFVVPRSMPITLPMSGLLTLVGGSRAVRLFDTNADHGRSQDAVVQEIASLEDLGHRVGRDRRIRIGRDGLVPLRIERLADAFHRPQALGFELGGELTLDQGDALDQRVARPAGAHGRHGPLEVVEDREDPADQAERRVAEVVVAFAIDTLLEVLEIGLKAYEPLAELAILGRRRRGRWRGRHLLEHDLDVVGIDRLDRHAVLVDAHHFQDLDVLGELGVGGELALRLVLPHRHPQAPGLVRKRVRTWARWSTSAMARAYSMRVGPTTPTVPRTRSPAR